MADLDDFFAKKDKKKGKTKKFLSSEELVKQLEQQSTVKEKPETKVVEESSERILENDEEWATFEESTKKVDLTNLKLGQLTLDEEEQNQILSSDGNIESEQQQTDDNEKNPWKKVQVSSQAEVVVAPKPAPSSIYIPPGVVKGEAMIKKKKKNMPDLQNEQSFPELGTDKVEIRFAKRDGFEEVKHGASFKSLQAQQAPVTTANSFTSLSNETDTTS